MIRTHLNRTWLFRASAWVAILALALHQFGSVVPTQAQVGQGFNLNASDLRFIMRQIRISERHAATATASNPCGTLIGNNLDQIPTGGVGITLPWGLRTVDGSCNHLTPGQETFGTADQLFPRLVAKDLRNAEAGTSYTQTTGQVTDSQPRVISNLIVDQSLGNPAAVVAAGDNPVITNDTLFIPNVAPDVGLSAPFNSWFTLFGQFFDHGLDLVNKSGNGSVFVPLKSDDPLFAEASANGTPFMILTRATHEGDHEANNQTSSFVDQSQTYTSHASHQVFLRQYELVAGRPVGTGRLITSPGGGMATWADVKEQALDMLGIALQDLDALSIPLLATDAYGRFLRNPSTGFPQMVKFAGGVTTLVSGTPSAPVNTVDAVRTGHAFLDDIAHTANPGQSGYNATLLGQHFIAGDGRVNENIGLTAVHHIFHSEHNRLVADIADMIVNDTAFTQAERDAWSATTGPAGWDLGERLFQAARFVTEMEYQHLAFEEFIRKVQPLVNLFGEGGTGFHPSIDPAIRAEFAHAVYRFGHSMLTETVDRISATGASNPILLLNAFLNPPAFNASGATPDVAAGAIIRGMTRQVANEIDEFVTEALRNRLLGLPLDLPTLNLARARDTGIPGLNAARRRFFAITQNSALTPYPSWKSFGLSIRHPESLENFLAAYGAHPTITTASGLQAKRNAANALLAVADPAPLVDDPDRAAKIDAFDFLNSTDVDAGESTNIQSWLPVGGVTITGVDDIDLWVGGLAEKGAVFGGLLGPTFNYVFETQMEDLQNGDRFYYLSRTVGLNLLVQLEGNSFAELIGRNTDAQGLPADVFSRPTFIFNLNNLGTSGPILDDPETVDVNESTVLIRLTDGTIRYTGPEHVVFNGTSSDNRVWSSEGDDTIRGNDGNDWMEGGDGNDNLIGGLGDDIMLDLAGDDTLKGGDGNDVMSSGQGFGGDLNQGGRGSDYIVGGNDTTETFGGPGNDFVYAGDAEDTVFGDDGDDWVESGRGPFALLQGDNGAPFQDDPNVPGHDVLMGYGGEVDYDSEGGDDIMFMGPGIQRAEGMLGFDWSTHRSDPIPGDSDMLITGLLPPSVETNRDRFDLTEALSGWIRDDTLRGDDRTDVDLVDNELLVSNVSRITGLAAILPAPTGAIAFNGGNILLGGAGSDVLEGRGGNDIIDGDRWLDARIEVTGSPLPTGVTQFHNDMSTLSAAMLAGQINPNRLRIVRSINTAAANPGVDIDIAVFSGPLADYDIIFNPDDGTTTVTHVGGTAIDGTDTLRNIEVLQFADQLLPTFNSDPSAPFVLLRSPIADTFVQGGAANANVNFGARTTLRTQTQGTTTGLSRTYLKFEIPPIPADAVIQSVRLRLYATDPSTNPQTVYAAGSNWSEIDTDLPLTFTNAATRAPRGTLLAAQPAPDGLIYVEIPLPEATIPKLPDASEIGFEIVGGADLAVFNSREATANRPQLVMTLASDPTQPPSAPTGVTATAGNAAATVSWTAPANNGGSPITGYTATSSPGSLTCTAPATGTSCTVTGLTNGTAYTFTVRAANAIGSSSGSVASNVVTPIGQPGAPIIGTAVAGNASAVVNWTAPASNGGSPITGYTATSSPGSLTCTAPAAGTSCTVTGLTNGTAYTFTVRAANAAGAGPASAASNSVTPTGSPAPQPIVLTATADAYVQSGLNAARNFGAATTLITREGAVDNLHRTYLRFVVPADALRTTSSTTRLRLFVTNSSTSSQIVSVTGTWGETTINFNNAPAATTQVGTVTPTTTGAYVEIPLSLTVPPLNTMTINLRILSSGNDVASFNSREVATNRPQLVVTGATGTTGQPGAPTIGTAVAGNASAVVNWTAPASNGGSPITGYTATSSPGSLTCTAPAAGTSCTVTGLTNGTAYTFTVRAANAAGAGPASAASNSVTPTGSPAPQPIVLTATADAYVQSGLNAARNFGAATTLITREGAVDNLHRTYLRFVVPADALRTTSSTTRLRLFVTNSSTSSQIVSVTGTWGETTINFNNAPAATTQVGTVTPTTTGAYVEIPLSLTVPPLNTMTINLRILSSGNDVASFNSREVATNRPQLVVTPAP